MIFLEPTACGFLTVVNQSEVWHWAHWRSEDGCFPVTPVTQADDPSQVDVLSQ